MQKLINNVNFVQTSHQNDIVDDLYKINISGKSTNDLNNDFCKYYTTTNVKTNEEFFAAVFNKNYSYPQAMFEAFKGQHFRGIINLVTYSVVKLTALNSCHLVAIFKKYNTSNTLSNYVEANGPLSMEEIQQSLIPAITEVLDHCEKYNIPLGNIHPDNIIVLPDKSYILKPCITSYPHFYQDDAFLSPEIADCTESGRYAPNITADIYALGMTVFYALTGKQFWLDQESFIHFNSERFEQTTFKYLISAKRMPESLKVFFKWVLHDDARIRWRLSNILEWLSGHSNNKTLLKIDASSSSPLSFNGHNYSTLKSVSHALFHSWDEAIKFLQDDKLIKWANRNHLSTDLIEKITEILKESKKLLYISNFNVDWSKKLTNLLSVIDPFGGIKLKGIGFTIYSIPYVIYHLFINNKRSTIEYILKSLNEKELLIQQDLENQGLEAIIKLFSATDKFLPIFSIERIMYSLNQTMPCLSPMVIDYYAVTVPDLLTALNQAALDKQDKFFIDLHVIAFIAAKLGIEEDSSLKILKNFPKFSDNSLIYGLSIVYVAHQHAPEIKIPNLFSALMSKVINLFNKYVHNIKFKNTLKEKLISLSKDSDFAKVIELLTNQTPFINDYNGYYNAVNEVKKLKKQIQFLHTDNLIHEKSLILGQKLTVMFSYLLCLLVTVILIL